MKYLILSCILCLSANVFAQSAILEKHLYLQNANIGNYSRVKMTSTSPAKVNILLQKGVALDHIDWLDAEKTTFAAELSKNDITIIRKENNSDIEIIVDDLEYHYAHQNDAIQGKNNGFNTVTAYPAGFNLGSMGGYLTWAEYISEMDSLHNMYPTLVSTKFSIGTTVEGRDIWAFKISDNVTTDETEPEVLIDAVIHAREGVAGMQSMYFVYDLLQKYMQNDPEAKFLVNNREIFIVPIINPDGYEYNRSIAPSGGGMWRKNRSDNGDGTFGVDLNRNWGHFWGYDNSGSSPNPASDLYRGPSGFSEPETQAMRNFVNARRFETALNHHTFSNLMIRPYGYNEATTCPDEQAFTEYGPILTEQNGFLYGKASETVGYNVNGSTDDWMYGEATTKPRIVSFTPETGGSNDGFWPPLARIVPLCELVEDANFKIVWLAGEYFQGDADPHTISNFTGFVPFYFHNAGQNTSLPVVAKFVSTSPYLLPSTPAKNMGGIASLVYLTDSVQVNIAPNTPNNTYITGEIQATFGGYTHSMAADFLFRRPLSIENANKEESITLFPNPAQDRLNIKGETPIARAQISDVLGRIIDTQNLNNQANTSIDTKNLLDGVYLLSLYNKENILLGTVKFVKE
jgi:murein tripeptide amidase MpaA